MKAIENAIYCKLCVGKLSRHTPGDFALRYPASHYCAIGTCEGCGKSIETHKASKVVRREL